MSAISRDSYKAVNQENAIRPLTNKMQAIELGDDIAMPIRTPAKKLPGAIQQSSATPRRALGDVKNVHDTPQAKAQPSSMLRDKLKHRVDQRLKPEVLNGKVTSTQSLPSVRTTIAPPTSTMPSTTDEPERACARMPNDDAEFADYYLGPADERLDSVSSRQWEEATQPKVMKFDELLDLIYDGDDEATVETREFLINQKKRRDNLTPAERLAELWNKEPMEED